VRSVLLAALFALGCSPFAREPQPAAEPWLAWQAPLGRDDALAGRVYDTTARRFLSPDEVVARASAAEFVLLGEKHDNPDQHRLQAWLIGALAHAGRRPAVVFEMIPRDRAGALTTALEAHPSDPDALATALDWSQSGWPPFALYRPVFEAALSERLPIAPGDLARGELARLRQGGLAAIAPAERERLALEPPPSAEARRSLAEEVREAHCGMAPDAIVEAMIDMQRARDATLADALIESETANGAVLIAGAGHARKDRGAPLYLSRRATGKSVLSLAFVEVSRASAEPRSEALDDRAAEYGEGFDLVWFTPRVDDDDPCERFRRELEKMRAPKPAPPQA
jgi:uncharacterized iron-regulated protein